MRMNTVNGTYQQQSTVISPAIIQSLKLLQMPVTDLLRNIELELQENPFLELENESSTRKADKAEENYQALKSHIEKQDSQNPMNYIAAKKTLKDYLYEQARSMKSKRLIGICLYIIENIDERGYLSCDISDIASDLRVPLREAVHALRVTQGFSPNGIAARDLRECLTIQLRNKKIRDKNLYKLINEQLELLASHKYNEIAKKLKVDLKKVNEYRRIIQKLEPKPARGFYTESAEGIVIPEFSVIKLGEELYIVRKQDNLPRLVLNNYYIQHMKQTPTKDGEAFMKEKLDSAVNLIKGIEERTMTLYKIIERILQLQRDFFLQGESYLRPMTIEEVALGINLHESTVSRAIKDKYIEAPFGTIKLKTLFSTGIKSVDEEQAISSTVIKSKLKKIIEAEDKNKPLSDQELSESLRKENIEISRRTVAKYREELSIVTSSKRRKG